MVNKCYMNQWKNKVTYYCDCLGIFSCTKHLNKHAKIEAE